jgi:hypothetical protein
MITKKQLPPKAVEAFFKANLKVRDQRDALVVFLNAWPGACRWRQSGGRGGRGRDGEGLYDLDQFILPLKEPRT